MFISLFRAFWLTYRLNKFGQTTLRFLSSSLTLDVFVFDAVW